MDLLGKIFKRTSNGKIFVQIASYRDPELVPTIRSLIENSSNPDNLKVCILNQWHPDDNIDLSEWAEDTRFEIISVKSIDSKGTCWARHQINKKYSGEQYTLQLDSHHRFIKGWDTELVNMLNGLIDKGVEKPILTAYVPSYNPNNDPQERVQTPWQLNFDKFTPEGAVMTLPAVIPNYEKLEGPIKSRFFSGHFMFTLGKFIEEVPYDPELYFHGEEITMAVRAFTNGWDLYTPHKVILFHEYTREGRIKHWDEHDKWHELDHFSYDRMRKILGIDGKVCSPCLKKRIGIYHLGDKKSKEEYEQYSGIHFLTRGVTEYTLTHNLPPNPSTNLEKEFLKHSPWEVLFPKFLLDGHLDFEFWAIILLDDQGIEIFRQDIDKHTIKLILDKDENEIIYKGQYRGRPYKNWVVWPHNNGKWLRKITGEKL